MASAILEACVQYDERFPLRAEVRDAIFSLSELPSGGYTFFTNGKLAVVSLQRVGNTHRLTVSSNFAWSKEQWREVSEFIAGHFCEYHISIRPYCSRSCAFVLSGSL